MASHRGALENVYRKMYKAYGPQYWWPSKTPFEVIVGAILTQNTAWTHVEQAIQNLKRSQKITPGSLIQLPTRQLAQLIRPAGYFNIKAKRLKNFLSFFEKTFKLRIDKMRRLGIPRLRSLLLSVNGIGKETADCILLYALGKPIFVVDTYTHRIFSRHRLIPQNAKYDTIQALFHQALPKKRAIYNEYHALIVKIGKDLCKKKARCDACPLNYLNRRQATRYQGIRGTI